MAEPVDDGSLVPFAVDQGLWLTQEELEAVMARFPPLDLPSFQGTPIDRPNPFLRFTPGPAPERNGDE